MKFDKSLIEGVLIKRHSRFLADVELTTGEFITAHTSNTGAMLGCKEPGSRVWLSKSSNPKRKYAFTWEIVESTTSQGGVPVGINTQRSNHLVKEAIENGAIEELQGYSAISTEVKYGIENSRIDLMLHNGCSRSDEEQACYVEVKNVTLVDDGVAFFPDAVSKRGVKHLRELMHVVQQGDRAVIFFCVQRMDASKFSPADSIDPEYGRTLRNAIKTGVEPLAYLFRVSSESIEVDKRIPVAIPVAI